MGDFVKIAVKTALVATICVAIYQLFATVTVSLPTLTLFYRFIQKAKAILFFYLPWVSDYWGFIMILCEVALGIWGFYFAMLAIRWILKVNE